MMLHDDPPELRPHLVGLLLWRAALAFSALIVVVKRPLDIPLVVALSMLGILLLIGEAAYRSKVYLVTQRLRREREQALREERAEAARLRFEAMREAQRDADGSYMNLDLDELDGEQDTPPPVADGVVGMSERDFELAVMGRDTGVGRPIRPVRSASVPG